jgi:hypothetical protein
VPDPSLSATQGRGSFTKFSWLRRNLATEPQPPLPDQSQLINVIKHQIETKESRHACNICRQLAREAIKRRATKTTVTTVL